jgi:tetratricopeptide (TPR) repeat protein
MLSFKPYLFSITALSLSVLAPVSALSQTEASVAVPTVGPKDTLDLSLMAKDIALSSHFEAGLSQELNILKTSLPLVSAPPPSARLSLGKETLDYIQSVGDKYMSLSPITTDAKTAPVPSNCPDIHKANSTKVVALLNPAVQAMNKSDIPSLKDQLPALEALLNELPLAEIQPNVCKNRIDVYTTDQFFKLQTLKAAGAETGYPKELPFFKHPSLPYTDLAFVVGWVHYELGSSEIGINALAKGLVMEPSNLTLTKEYLALLRKASRHAEAISYTLNYIKSTPSLRDEDYSTLFANVSLSLLLIGDVESAKLMLGVSLAYNVSESNLKLLSLINTVAPEKPKS